MRKLTGKQREALAEAVAQNYRHAEFRRELSFINRMLDTLTVGEDMITIAFTVIEKAELAGWLDELLGKLAAGNRPDVAELCQRILAQPDPASPQPRYGVARPGAARVEDDPWLRPTVQGMAFLNRMRLREALRELMSPSPSRVLRVTGDRGSGRSYSWRFLAYLREVLPAYHPVLVDFNDWPASGCEPLEIFKSLAAQLGFDLPPAMDRHAQSAARVHLLRDWLVGKLNEKRKPPEHIWLLTFDSLDHFPVPQDVLDFLTHLIAAAERNQVPGLRVVLLGDPGPLALQHTESMLAEMIKPLTDADIRDFFHRVALESGTRISDDALAAMVTQMNAQLPLESAARALELPGLASRFARVVFQRET